MKKLTVFLLLPVLLCGCARKEAPTGPMCRVVTQIKVAATVDGQTNSKTYTDPEGMQSVLNYLRLMKKSKQTDIDPDSFRADSYEITLYYSDGQYNTYRQLHDGFLQIDGGSWQEIETKKMELLFP